MHPLPLGRYAETEMYHAREEFFIPGPARRKHMYVVGTTGSGKSTLIRNCVAWDVARGLGVTVVDPHGDLVLDILKNHIPRSRTNDVVYCDPSLADRAFSINILEVNHPAQQPLAVSQVVSIFYRLYRDTWGARLEDILRNSLFALIEQPKPMSLAAIPRLLSDKAFREEIIPKVKNPIVKEFFERNYAQWKEGFREEAISPVLNKIRAFLTNPLLLHVIGPTRSSFDFRWAIDNRKIVLVNLSKGQLGEDASKLLGSLFVAKEKLAALSRSNIPEEERVFHALYIDEAQNFIGDFEAILSEARKYRLLLHLVTQSTQQLDDAARAAIFANCATMIAYRVSGTDAELIKHELASDQGVHRLQNLPDYQAMVRTLDDSLGASRPAGSPVLQMFPPFRKAKENNSIERVMRTSLQRFTRPRAEVARDLARFFS